MLNSLSLQNFRNYKKASFDFNNSVVIIGPNTSGKSNLIESIYL
ncbi:MAG: AAA family ATPase, partial [Patescibacteria group bacterium]